MIFTDGVPMYQVGYAANLNLGNSVINLTNTGFTGGNLCVNAYAFDTQEEQISCCSCLVTPDGMNSLSVNSDLISNPLTPTIPTSITVALVTSQPSLDPAGRPTICNPASPNAISLGTLAWGTTLEPGSAGGFGAVPVPFLNAPLGLSELTSLTSLCNFIQSQGTGYGICGSCRTGGLGGAKK